jgi:muconolactone delta-isomerase
MQSCFGVFELVQGNANALPVSFTDAVKWLHIWRVAGKFANVSVFMNGLVELRRF